MVSSNNKGDRYSIRTLLKNHRRRDRRMKRIARLLMEQLSPRVLTRLSRLVSL